MEYEVQVRATNAEGTGGWSDPPGSGATDANAAPSFTSPATVNAAENQLAVGTVAAADSDSGDSVTGYALQGGADAIAVHDRRGDRRAGVHVGAELRGRGGCGREQ